MSGESQALADLSKPSLAALSHVLRNPELWPAGFEWGYTMCCTCAIGMAGKLWNECDRREGEWADEAGARIFGIDESVASAIFLDADVSSDKAMEDVTPADVADAIDAHLALVAEATP